MWSYIKTVVLSPRLAVVVLLASGFVAVIPFSLRQRMSVVVVICVVLVIIDVVLAVDPNHVTIRRQLPSSVSLNATAPISWDVSHSSAHRQRIVISDEIMPSLSVKQRTFEIVVPAGSPTVVSSTMRPTRRGELKWDKVGVRVYGPLLLAGRQRRLAIDASLTVYPDFRSRREAELRIQRSRILEVGLRVTRAKGAGTEFDSLREYTPDDQFRRIDWSATQRVGKPIVREYRIEQNQTVICLLDLGRSMTARIGDTPRIEYAMDAILALSTVASAAGDHVGLVAFDSRVRRVVLPSRSKNSAIAMTRAMYQLQSSLDESDYDRAFAETLQRFRRRSYVVLFTDTGSASLSEFVIPALPALSKRHVVGIASPSDPEVLSWRRGTPLDPSAAFLRAAATAELAQRRLVADILRQRGTLVVDGSPESFAGQVVDSYLSLKGSNRL
jgi:uncharacterized protein (DUF58 family)